MYQQRTSLSLLPPRFSLKQAKDCQACYLNTEFVCYILTCCAVSCDHSLAPSVCISAQRADWSAAHTRVLASHERSAGVHGRWVRFLDLATPPRAVAAMTLPLSPGQWLGPAAQHSGPWEMHSERRVWSSPPKWSVRKKTVKKRTQPQWAQWVFFFQDCQNDRLHTCSFAVCVCKAEFCSCRVVVCRCSATIWLLWEEFWFSSCLSCSFNRLFSVCREAFWRT